MVLQDEMVTLEGRENEVFLDLRVFRETPKLEQLDLLDHLDPRVKSLLNVLLHWSKDIPNIPS
jgi:hypothetical protein